MIRAIVILTVTVALTGCGGLGLIDEIPRAEFKKFEYHRGGNVTSAHITATDSRIVDGGVEVGSINIQADYGPAVNFNIKLEGYRRLPMSPHR